MWPLPLPFHLIQGATATAASTAVFALNISAPAVAFLRDYRVSSGTASACMLPAAALFEVVASAVHMLMEGQLLQPIQLTDCAVQSAVMLPNLTGSMAAPPLCTVDCRTGAARISSRNAAHFTAQAGVCAAPAAVSSERKHSAGVISRLLQQRQVPAHLSQRTASAASAVAAVSHLPLQQASGYLTHPAATEVATLLQAAVSSVRTLHTAAVSCQGYMASCTPLLQQGMSVSAALDSPAELRNRRSKVDVCCRQAEAAAPWVALSELVMAVRRFKGGTQAPSSPALQLIWQPIASKTTASSQQLPQTWLILSNQPCALRDICNDATGAVTALNIVYAKQPVKGTADVVVSSDAELQLVLSEARADHCFLAQHQQQQPDLHAGDESPARLAAESASLLWAFRAFRRAQPRAKLSLVTWGTQSVGPYGATAAPESLMAIGEPSQSLRDMIKDLVYHAGQRTFLACSSFVACRCPHYQQVEDSQGSIVLQPQAYNAAAEIVQRVHVCVFAGLARTLFMEQRALFGPTIDLQAGAGLPSAAQLAHIACSSGEFAVAFRNGRAFGMRMVPSASPVLRSVTFDGAHSSVVSGGTKV